MRACEAAPVVDGVAALRAPGDPFPGGQPSELGVPLRVGDQMQTAEQPGAPWWMRSMAAVTLASGGNRQSSRQMWQSIAQSATVEYQRNHAQRALAQLDSLDAIDVLTPLVERFARETGAPPRDWQPLVRAGLLRGTPVDPAGVPFTIRPDGTVDVDPASPLSPLPKEPPRTVPQ